LRGDNFRTELVDTAAMSTQDTSPYRRVSRDGPTGSVQRQSRHRRRVRSVQWGADARGAFFNVLHCFAFAASIAAGPALITSHDSGRNNLQALPHHR
jgi:hypothetical protein